MDTSDLHASLLWYAWKNGKRDWFNTKVSGKLCQLNIHNLYGCVMPSREDAEAAAIHPSSFEAQTRPRRYGAPPKPKEVHVPSGSIMMFHKMFVDPYGDNNVSFVLLSPEHGWLALYRQHRNLILNLQFQLDQP